MQRYSKEYENVKYFNVLEREKAKSPKKNALHQAIRIASGDIILLTDADCIPTSNWVNSHVAIYERKPDTEMVVGFSKIRVGDLRGLPMYNRFEYVDFLILMFAAQGAIQSGNPFSCSGQNLSYKRGSFYDVGGFNYIDHLISGDDVLLMQKFVRYKKEIRFAAFSNAFTETMPITSWKALLNQRSRWASNLKIMYKLNTKFFLYLTSCFLFMGLFPILPLLVLLISLLSPSFYAEQAHIFLSILFAFAILIFLRWIFDVRFINYALENWGLSDKLKYINRKNRQQTYISEWLFISPFYIILVTFMGLFSMFIWKNRKEI